MRRRFVGNDGEKKERTVFTLYMHLLYIIQANLVFPSLTTTIALCVGKDTDTTHVSPSKIGEQDKGNKKANKFSVVTCFLRSLVRNFL